ncbi:hypothetical protein ELS19_17995 [Halogeometricum borinquense]|uniref:Putative glutamine amidotransferase domain-containing protein n=1 Tax=Halogeometricum borinquense TaxID=60847 RepID=A0A482T919_9EURY|nr:glutamine amidotransferase [Halogeometricum borinquense]RYJ08429.1 hypothetical protein ELS19_17995 [Halogeometricum borinquense]
MTRVLLAGESWTTVTFEVKGRNVLVDADYGTAEEHLVAALEVNGADVDFLTCEETLTSFPGTREELDSYDLVLLSDVGADSLQLTPAVTAGDTDTDRCRLLAEYVRDGGALGMIGGYMSFAGKGGAARYGRTPIADVLPVEIRDGDDRVETPAGAIPMNRGVPADLPETWPAVLGYNHLQAKDDADVWATVGDRADPFVVVGEAGAGRTFAFATDCAPHWAPMELLEWDGLPVLWGALLDWATKET